MTVTIIQARHGTLAYCSSAVTWDTAALIDDETFTGNINEVKNLTVTLPEQSVEQVPCLGATAQTVGANARTAGTATGIIAATFQNAALDMKSFTNYKFAGTLIFTGDEQFAHVLGLDAGTAWKTATAHRYAIGNLSSGAWAKTLTGALRIYLNNGSEKASVGMSNVIITKMGDIKPTGADGHWEMDFECECLPKDGAIEYLD